MFGAFQPVPAELLDGFFHRIERVGGRGQHGEFGQQRERARAGWWRLPG
jgi:hypothetical protein